MRILLSWIGFKDLEKMKDDEAASIATLACRYNKVFHQIVLLDSLKEADAHKAKPFRRWLAKRLEAEVGQSTEILHEKVQLKSVVDYESITSFCEDLLQRYRQADNEIYINLTSGTPAMAAVWTILGYGVEGTTLLQSSPQNEILPVNFPNDFKVTYTKYKSYTSKAASEIGNNNIDEAFNTITFRSDKMQHLVEKARRLGQSDLPALILGETGTGKELMAKAIHDASLRKDAPFEVINCGALAQHLVESTLFGHVKGAFTGAVNDHDGLFVTANGGTVFLDEVGELPLDVQVKLLRVLNDSKVTPVGAIKVKEVKIRIIAATHRPLSEMVTDGSFREDLYYRLAVGIIELPPLRERKDDLDELIDQLLQQCLEKAGKHPNFQNAINKGLSKQARNWLKAQLWPGNIRELKNTIERAVLWSDGDVIEEKDFAEHVTRRTPPEVEAPAILSPQDELDLDGLIAKINAKYCQAAVNACGGNHTRAAKMLKLNSRQVLDNRLAKLKRE